MSAMMSIYQGDGTRNDVPSVFIGVDEDRSDRLRVAFGIPCKTMVSFECSLSGARELAQWLFDRGIQEWSEFPSASTLRISDERFSQWAANDRHRNRDSSVPTSSKWQAYRNRGSRCDPSVTLGYSYQYRWVLGHRRCCRNASFARLRGRSVDK
jgi:hypothetical protein